MAIDEARLLKIIASGVKAPSGDNCQPWRFKWQAERLFLYNEEDRDTSLYNTLNTASFIAHGALIENMDIAAKEAGLRMTVELFPDGEESPVIACIRFEYGTVEKDPLYPFIETRCTNRESYKARELEVSVRESLQETASEAEESGGSLTLIEDKAPKLIASKVASLNDRLLFENQELHDFLFAHIRWTKEEAEATGDGMDIRTFGLNPMESRIFKLLENWSTVKFMNLFGLSRMLPGKTNKACNGSSAMGLIQMNGLSPESFVLGGRLLERIWLKAASLGLAFQPMTGVPLLIQRLYLEADSGLNETHKTLLRRAETGLKRIFPLSREKAIIMLFRVGYAETPRARSLRRDVVIED
jgi:nitroreductase